MGPNYSKMWNIKMWVQIIFLTKKKKKKSPLFFFFSNLFFIEWRSTFKAWKRKIRITKTKMLTSPASNAVVKKQIFRVPKFSWSHSIQQETLILFDKHLTETILGWLTSKKYRKKVVVVSLVMLKPPSICKSGKIIRGGSSMVWPHAWGGRDRCSRSRLYGMWVGGLAAWFCRAAM